MNKCSILIIFACFMPLQSQAHWYTGVNLGVNSVKVKKDLLYPIDDTQPTTSNFNSAYTNFQGQLLAGYHFFASKKIGAAIEANADFFTGKAQHSVNNWFLTNSAYVQERLEYGGALFLLPSYKLNELTHLFIGPGISRSRFALRSGITGGNIGVTGRFNQWLTGGAVKVGIATKIHENTELLLSYQYTQFNSFSRIGMEPLSEDFLKGRYKPNVNTFMVGIRASMPEFIK